MARQMGAVCVDMAVNFETVLDNAEKLKEDIDRESHEKKELEAMIAELEAKLHKSKKGLKSKYRKRDELSAKWENLKKFSPQRWAKLRYRLEHADKYLADFREELLHAALSKDHAMSLSAGQGAGSEEVNATKVTCLGSRFGGVDVPGRYYTPAAAQRASLPVIVYFHGGGFVAGDLDTHDWLCRSLASLACVAVVAVEYRRAPEDKFPAAFDDAYAAVRWVSAGGLGRRVPQLAVAGDSAGGNLAAGVCIRAAADPAGPAILLQLLICPWLDLRPEGAVPESEANGDQFDELEWFRESYGPYGPNGPRKHPAEEVDLSWCDDVRASPLTVHSVKGLPQAFIAHSAEDILGGAAAAFAARMREENGPRSVHLLRFAGAAHGFARDRQSSESHAAIAAAAAFASVTLWAPAAASAAPQAVASPAAAARPTAPATPQEPESPEASVAMTE